MLIVYIFLSLLIGHCMSDTEPFEQKCLKVHNEYRKMHGAHALILDSKLTKYAQVRIKTLTSTDKLEHIASNPYGENLFMGTGLETYADSAVDMWYKELRDYNFKKHDFAYNTGHFTQVVWANSKRLGCAIGKATKSGNVYVVAIYDPPGNVLGRFVDNVKPLKKKHSG